MELLTHHFSESWGAGSDLQVLYLCGFRWRSLAFRTAWQQSLSWQWKLFGWWEGGQSFYHLCCLVFFKISIGLKIGVFTMKTLNDFNKKNLPWKHIPNHQSGVSNLHSTYTSHLSAKALAGGSGITPVLSLLRQCREECRSSFAKPHAKSDVIKEFSIIHAMRSMDERHIWSSFLGCGFKNQWCVCLHFCYQLPLHFLKLEAVTLASHPKTSQGTTTWIP